MHPRIVIDTNVLVAALRSSLGASYTLLELVGRERFEIAVSAPLVLEYEDVLKRPDLRVGLSVDEIDAVLDYLCSVGERAEVFYLWRPLLSDPKDDMVLEVAVAGGCDTIVTFNERDFRDARQFGLEVMRPQAFLRRIGELK
jgi:putative PIN family toxin of toxin-antitoxin system